MRKAVLLAILIGIVVVSGCAQDKPAPTTLEGWEAEIKTWKLDGEPVTGAEIRPFEEYTVSYLRIGWGEAPLKTNCQKGECLKQFTILEIPPGPMTSSSYPDSDVKGYLCIGREEYKIFGNITVYATLQRNIGDIGYAWCNENKTFQFMTLNPQLVELYFEKFPPR